MSNVSGIPALCGLTPVSNFMGLTARLSGVVVQIMGPWMAKGVRVRISSICGGGGIFSTRLPVDL